MKVLLKTFIVSIVLLMIALFASNLNSGVTIYAKKKTASYTVTSYKKYIAVKWKKKAVKYKIYRKDVTKLISEYRKGVPKSKMPKEKKYKKIATVKGKKSYKDKKAKSKRLYAYIVKGYNKRGKKVFSTYSKKKLKYSYVAKTETPKLKHSEWNIDRNIYARDDINHIYIYVENSDTYYAFAKYEFLRKEESTNKFVKVKLERADDKIFLDKSVVPGKTYTYKVRMYLKNGKKKIYSKHSNEYTNSAYNRYGEYKIECLTKAGTYTSPFDAIVKIENANAYNGKTIIYPVKYQKDFVGDDIVRYYNEPDNWGYCTQVLEYSLNNEDWNSIPGTGLELSNNKPIYLKFNVVGDDEGQNIKFNGSSISERSEFSEQYAGFIKYRQEDYTRLLGESKVMYDVDFDLLKGTAFSKLRIDMD